MLAKHLSQEIERYAERLQRENRLLELARRGEVTLDIVVGYLSGVAFMLGRTEPHLERAAARAREQGRPKLAEFYEHKRREETGHERWAQDDFSELRRLFGAAAAKPVPRAIVELARFLEDAMDAAPASYLAYILFAEYLTVLVGPTWLTLLEERCGIPKRALSAISKHVELDVAHVDEGLREIDALITSADAPALSRVLTHSMEAYDASYQALYDTHLSAAPAPAAL